jgi:hypothetical protein
MTYRKPFFVGTSAKKCQTNCRDSLSTEVFSALYLLYDDKVRANLLNFVSEYDYSPFWRYVSVEVWQICTNFYSIYETTVQGSDSFLTPISPSRWYVSVEILQKLIESMKKSGVITRPVDKIIGMTTRTPNVPMTCDAKTATL